MAALLFFGDPLAGGGQSTGFRNVQNAKFAGGPIALQFAPGVVKDKRVIKFRKVEIKRL